MQEKKKITKKLDEELKGLKNHMWWVSFKQASMQTNMHLCGEGCNNFNKHV